MPLLIPSPFHRSAPILARRPCRFGFLARIVLLAALLAFLTVSPAPLCAQMGPVLNQSYYDAISLLNDGDYTNALDAFKSELRGGIKVGTVRWLDSVCYYAMIGESYYRLGQYEAAVENYGAALAQYMQYPNWMGNVNFPPKITTVNHVAYPWGTRTAQTKFGKFPAAMTMSQGKPVTANDLQKGGVITPPKFVAMPVQEIVRCVTVSIKRRSELLGPVAKHDQLLTQTLDALQKNPAPPNSWTQAWHDVQVGAALTATGNKGQAIAVLKRAVAANEEIDHPLTPYALLMLGHHFFEDAKYDEANVYFAQATYSGAEYGDLGVLEEAFRMSFLIHVLTNRKGVFKQLESAAGWAKKVNARELYSSLLVLAAESAALNSQTKGAAALLAEARAKMARSAMLAGEIGVRLLHVTALVEFQNGKLANGDAATANCLALAKNHSKWLYQLAVASARLANNTLSERNALAIFERLADDPHPKDWAERPLDALLTLSTPHQQLFEVWFELLLAKEFEAAFDIADKAKRHRLFNNLPYGGRLVAIRWLLEGPSAALDKEADLQRQELLAKYPQYGDLAKQSAKLREQLAALPLAPDKPEEVKRQSELMAEWSKVSGQQELLIRQMALRREATKLVFPPVTTVKELQANLPQGEVVLLTYATSRNIHALLISKTQYSHWRVADPALLEKKLAAMLKGLGNYDANRELTPAQLADKAWQTAARECVDTFLVGSKVNFAKPFDELVIVPDGVLWYLPWEAVQVGEPKPGEALIVKKKIRYVPTAGLVHTPRTLRNPRPEIGVVAGKLHPRGEAKLTEETWRKLSEKLPLVRQLKPGLNIPSPLFAGIVDQLIVLDDLNTLGKGGLNWSPLNFDRAAGVGNLTNWLVLPWKRVDVLILPGFHTVAEELPKSGRIGDGQELFLASCGVLAGGTRTLLISRWRTGGASSCELLKNFVQELPFSSAPAAWQRSVQLAGETPLDFSKEPRLRVPPKDPPQLNAGHPFFWAGYMLIDTGVPGPEQAAPADPNAAPPAATVEPKAAGEPKGAADPKAPVEGKAGKTVAEPKGTGEPKSPVPPQPQPENDSPEGEPLPLDLPKLEK